MGPPPFKVKALYDYASPEEDDLKFSAGQLITVTDDEDADWYSGDYINTKGEKHEGIFPRNFVERFEPEPPPRPVRSNRPKKEVDVASAESQARPKAVESLDGQEDFSEAPTALAPALRDESSRKLETKPAATSSSLAEASLRASASKSSSDPQPTHPLQQSKAPAVVSEKPSGSSFRDRIAAFNNPKAAPVTPFKPGGSSGVKKPFIPPPPSRDAYVAPPRPEPARRVYRREDDQEMATRTSEDHEDTERAVLSQMPLPSSADVDDDQPKPTSLKERIALLQRQQADQAARHVEGGPKKEKAKRPSKKLAESTPAAEDAEGAYGSEADLADDAEVSMKRNANSNRDEHGESTILPLRQRAIGEPSENIGRRGLPAAPRDHPSDANDADQSGAGDTEDAEETSTGVDDSDDKPRSKRDGSIALSALPTQEPIVGDEKEKLVKDEGADEAQEAIEDEEGNEEEEQEEEQEEEMNPEERKRLEIRQRMMKMSGGMGMHDMFAPPGGMPPVIPRANAKKEVGSGSGHRSVTETNTALSPTAHAPPVPIFPLHGSTGTKSPVSLNRESEMGDADQAYSRKQGQLDAQEVEHAVPQQAGQGHLSASPGAQAPSQESRVAVRGPPPLPPHGERTDALHPPHLAARPIPASPRQLSSSAGDESDDELSIQTENVNIKASVRESDRLDKPAMTTPTNAPSLPSRSSAALSRSTPRISTELDNITSPSSPVGRAPPVPPGAGAIHPAPSYSRTPPPPPPTVAPQDAQGRTLSRESTGDWRPTQRVKHPALEESDEEVTEYDGDYDTDIASGAPHKEALKSHVKASEAEERIMTYGTSQAGSANPSVPPPLPPTAPPRSAPALLPASPGHGSSRMSRRSGETPRAAPPPLSPPKELTRPAVHSGDYDPFSYTAPISDHSTLPTARTASTVTSPPVDRYEQAEDLYNVSPRLSQVPPIPMPPSQPPPTRAVRSGDYDHFSYTALDGPVPPTAQMASTVRSPSADRNKQSEDLYDASPRNSRASPMPTPPSPPPPTRAVRLPSYDPFSYAVPTEHVCPTVQVDYGIACDINSGSPDYSWTQANSPPIVFQNKKDVMIEVDELPAVQHGGHTHLHRAAFILFLDYSQTIIYATFNVDDATDRSIEQHHKAPPQRPRQDELEAAHALFGPSIASAAASKDKTIVGDGSPQALILALLQALPQALLPIGGRSHGALVYANLANASVQQIDEIRPGDILTLRNAKFQGHRGPMHQKYSVDVGKPDHVGVVMEWDGTKKKVRAWEQGREGKKVKAESFKLGDLRSGEVKIWRVMSRSWVGWVNGRGGTGRLTYH